MATFQSVRKFRATSLHFTIIMSVNYEVRIYGTLYNIILRIARNLLETRENIKIESHPFYHIICDWFSWECFFLKKTSKMADSKKMSFSIPPILNIFFQKFHGLVLGLVGLIDWCEGHWCGSTYMAVRLSDISSKTT